MDYLYIRRDDNEQPYIEITGCKEAPRILRVPASLNDLPVRVIASHAFEKNEVIEQVILPESVHAIGTFAFYGCRNLREISLTDHAESWGTGAIYFCGSLSKIRLRVSRKRYSILRDILADTDQGLYVEITGNLSGQDHETSSISGLREEQTETAMLYFPSYTHGFDEDTYARAFHTWIEGCGFAYRETVTRTGIDFREYDLLFDRAMADGVGGVQVAAGTSLARMMFPVNMRPSARSKYENYLAANGDEILQRLVGAHDRERAMFLLDMGFVSPDAAGKAVLTAADQQDAELVGMLMRRRGTAGRRDAGAAENDAGNAAERFSAPDEFDLDEL